LCAAPAAPGLTPGERAAAAATPRTLLDVKLCQPRQIRPCGSAFGGTMRAGVVAAQPPQGGPMGALADIAAAGRAPDAEPAPASPPAPHPHATGAAASTIATLGAAAALSACGGGESPDSVPQAFLDLGQAEGNRRILAADTADATAAPATGAAAAPVPGADELLDWAELAFPSLFPGPAPTRLLPPYQYRFYPATGHYLGVAGGAVYLLGPITAGVLNQVGLLTDFAERVAARFSAFTDAQAARFLLQASLAASDAEIAAVRLNGYRAWLEAEFARPPSPSNWDWLVARGVHLNPDNRNLVVGFDNATWARLLTAPDGLRQRVALALSEIFVVGLDGITGPWRQFQMAAWWDLLVQHAFGSFRTLLEAVTLNLAMGRYLNTAGNQRDNPATGRVPDENYAREVMQLFTIGLQQLNPDGSVRTGSDGRPLDSYTQDTVTNLARVFTGWNAAATPGNTGPEQARLPMVLNAALHSTLPKVFLGASIPASTGGAASLAVAMDTLAAHPNVGPFIGRQLVQRLVTSNPSPAYVARVSAAFADNGQGQRGDLKAVIRAVLLDEEARSPLTLAAPGHGKLREPMLRFVQWARTFRARSITTEPLNWLVGNTSDPATALGQSPLRSPSVFNFFRPGYVPPNSAIGAAGLTVPELQIVNESSVAGYLNFMEGVTAAAHRDVRPDYAAELALVGDPAALLDRLDLLLTARQLTPATRSTIQQALASMPVATETQRNQRVYTAVMLVMASPEYLVQK
jgi:uncharacterized protein (DUF1800 family)